MQFSVELRGRRKEKGWSLREAAGRTGGDLSYSMLSRYERGVRLDRMSVFHANAISKLYRWSIKDINKKIATEV